MSHRGGAKLPGYISRENGQTRLNSSSLSDPEVFLNALRDFAAATASRTFDAGSFLHDDYHHADVLTEARGILSKRLRWVGEFAPNKIARVMNGFSAELFTRTLIRDVLGKFNRCDRSAPRMFEFDTSPGLKETIMLKSGLRILPLGHTNVIIQGCIGEIQRQLGEIDMLIETRDRNAFLVDVSTSAEAVNDKLHHSSNEQCFAQLRTRMMELFQASNQCIGYRSMSKMHVIIRDPSLHSEEIHDRNSDSVIVTMIPCIHIVHSIRNEIISMLKEKNYISGTKRLTFHRQGILA